MHKKMIEDATPEQIKEFLRDSLSMIKATDKELYKQLEMSLYKELYGCHFNEWLLKEATEDLINEDGSKGAHWTLEQTNSVAKANNLRFEHFNEYDFNYVMNIMYSNCYGSVVNDTNNYYRLSKAFLCDKNAKEGKALIYYLNIVK